MENVSSASGFSVGALSTELTVLLLACILAFVHLFAAAGAITKERGTKWNAGPRDDVMPPPGALAGRLDRAFRNFLETFPIFAVAVLVATIANRTNGQTALGAQLYLGARILYLPIYAAGVPYARSLAWGVALLGIILVLIGAFTPA
ncbi:MAG: MAPEG family protein [Caulobacterales bacterium]